MRIVFLGSGAFGLPVLRRLTEDHDVAMVVTQPDRPSGRGRGATPTPIGSWAEANDVPLLKSADINDPDSMDAVRAIDADAWVIIAFGQKLSPQLLTARFAMNLHASLLPAYRGAAPIHRALLAGEMFNRRDVRWKLIWPVAILSMRGIRRQMRECVDR